MHRKAFTLVEILIVTIIVWVLAYVVLKAYIVVTQIAFRIQQEKYVMTDLVFLSQNLQNIADGSDIDFSAYPTGELVRTQGITDRLILSGSDGRIEIYSTGDCVPAGGTRLASSVQTQCRLEMKKNKNVVVLTDAKHIYLSHIVFKIVPYASSQQYIADMDKALCKWPYLGCFHSPGFWIVGQAYSPVYSTYWMNNIRIPIQQFFNL